VAIVAQRFRYNKAGGEEVRYKRPLGGLRRRVGVRRFVGLVP